MKAIIVATTLLLSFDSIACKHTPPNFENGGAKEMSEEEKEFLELLKRNKGIHGTEKRDDVQDAERDEMRNRTN